MRKISFKEFYKLIKENIEDEFDLEFTVSAVDKACQRIFASLWADWMENEVPESSDSFVRLSGNDILEIAPLYTDFMTQNDAKELENKMYSVVEDFEIANGRDVKELYQYALEVDGSDEDSPEDFLFLILMRIFGHGISWEDSHKKPGFKYFHREISYMEFSESFPSIEEEETEEEEMSDEDDDEQSFPWEKPSDWWK